MSAPFVVYLIKTTRYDDDGYPLQWWRSLIPSNSLACVAGLVRDSVDRGVLPQRTVEVRIIDEVNSKVDTRRILADVQKAGGGVVFLVGVQSNQFPRAMDIARPLRAAGVQVAIGGFHVSGCLAMLRSLPPDLLEAQALGISFFAGEAEDSRMDAVLADAAAGALKPVYNHLKDTPNLGGAPVPVLPRGTVDRTISAYSSFDLGRGCPFECSFCTIINVQGRKSRFRTPDDLERIVRENAAIGVANFFLTDDNFARNRHWEAFLDRLILLRQRDGLKVTLNIQIDTLAHRIPNFVDKCWRAGAHILFIGLENINADNLAAAKKRQNRVEDYRAMVLAWKKHSVNITCGYIVGFPNDTAQSILADIEILKRELAIDNIYLNYLQPLPGSEDHKRLTENGVWMDPDMNKYDLTHRVTHHPRMSDAEWEDAYREAHARYYDWEHMERVIKRTVALKSNKRYTTIHRLMGYRESVRLEGVSFLESGLLRIKRRTQRRSGLPIESPLIFYPKYALHTLRVAAGLTTTYVRLRWLLAKALRDPARLAYVDAAILPVAPEAVDTIVSTTRGSLEAAGHRKRVHAVAAGKSGATPPAA